MAKPLTVSKNPSTMDQAYGDPGIYLNLAGPVVATADLPLAGSDMDGRIVIEDGGSGNVNLILYARQQRFRIDGGSNI